MVEDELDDGKRIAQLLASEITGHERPPLGRLSVENADPDAEPSLDGTFAYEVARDGAVVAEVYVHPDRARVEIRDALDAAGVAARDAGLRVRPKAVEPPRLLVFVESGAEVKRALPVLRALAAG
jgi:hypothetical protein